MECHEILEAISQLELYGMRATSMTLPVRDWPDAMTIPRPIASLYAG